jgi:hypothetical protein
VNPQPFGRRTKPQHQARGAIESVEVIGQSKKADSTDVVLRSSSPVLPKTQVSTGGYNSQEWKTREQGFRIPWRPVLLMASLSFGIASFVLPDTVNDAVQWLLYALMAAGIYATFRRGRSEVKS